MRASRSGGAEFDSRRQLKVYFGFECICAFKENDCGTHIQEFLAKSNNLYYYVILLNILQTDKTKCCFRNVSIHDYNAIVLIPTY